MNTSVTSACLSEAVGASSAESATCLANPYIAPVPGDRCAVHCSCVSCAYCQGVFAYSMESVILVIKLAWLACTVHLVCLLGSCISFEVRLIVQVHYLEPAFAKVCHWMSLVLPLEFTQGLPLNMPLKLPLDVLLDCSLDLRQHPNGLQTCLQHKPLVALQARHAGKTYKQGRA